MTFLAKLALLLALIVPQLLIPAEPALEVIDPAAVRATTEALCAIPQRGQGQPGADTAAHLIEQRLTALGLKPQRVRTTVSVEADRGSVLAGGGVELPLTPLAANHAATAGTEGQTLRGRLLFGGRGTLQDLKGKTVAGAIVVLEADCRDGWSNAAMLGALAIVVRGLDGLDRPLLGPLSLPISLPFPRFAVRELPAGWTEGQEVTLRSTVVWEPRTALSVCALIPAAPAAAGDAAGDAVAARLARQAVILAAGYEANGPVANPGATRAWNAATLLELTAGLVKTPANRQVLVVFHGGRGELMRGLREITGALVTDRGRDDTFKPADENRLEALLRFNQRQAWQVEGLKAVLAGELAGGKFAQADVNRRFLAEIAQREATRPPAQTLVGESKFGIERLPGRVFSICTGVRADELLVPLDRARTRMGSAIKQQVEIERQLKTGKATVTQRDLDEAKAAVAAAKAEVATLDPPYRSWRTTQQKLDANKPLSPEEDALVGSVVPATGAVLDRQLRLLRDRIADLQSLLDLRRAVGTPLPVHLIGVDLSDGNDRFAGVSGGFFVTWGGDLAWLTNTLMSGLAEKLQRAKTGLAWDAAPTELVSDAESWWYTGYQHEAGIAGLYLNAATLSTTADPRNLVGTPGDRPDQLRWANLDRQLPGLTAFVREYSSHRELSGRKLKITSFRDGGVECRINAIGTRNGSRGYLFPHVFIQHGFTSSYSGDVATRETRWGDLFGADRIPFLPLKHPGIDYQGFKLVVSSYDYTPTGGIFATLTGKEIKLPVSSADTLSDQQPQLFLGRPRVLYQIQEPRLGISLSEIRPLSASSDADPPFVRTEVGGGHAVCFTDPQVRLRVIGGATKNSKQMVLTGQDEPGRTPGAATVKGIAGTTLSQFTPVDVARDMLVLNEERLSRLRRNGIDSESLVALQSKGERHYTAAKQALAAADWPRAQGEAQAAWGYAGRAYPSVLATANDVVRGLVVLLLFAIPFAIVCERLFIAGATIARKVTGFAAFMIGVFLFFYFFHPAFALATTPMVIFLAFLILLLSAAVIGIVANRFELEMQHVRMASLGQHTADVSRLGTLVATLGLGISNMRRRKLRTALTTSTVVLMTFILLTFASFAPSLSATRINLDEAPPYQGILLRHNGWAPMDEAIIKRAQAWTGDFDILPLRWIQTRPRQPKIPVYAGTPTNAAETSPGKTPVQTASSFVSGVIGCVAGDPTRADQALVRGALNRPDSLRGFPAGAEAGTWLFLPEELLQRLGIQPGDPVRLAGLEFKAGVIDPKALNAATQIGGENITPLALEGFDDKNEDLSKRMNQLDASGTPTSEQTSVTHLGPGSVAVVHEAVAQRLGGTLRALSLVPRRPMPGRAEIDLPASADAIAQEVAMTLRVGHNSESYLYTAIGSLSVAGLGGVLVPLILGGLIIFSTMLNSVAERGREIFIYASLGLAPIHVAALFLVEAGIYAILGGLGGYILAQFIVSGLGVAAGLGWGVQPDLNYSSFTAVATILLVMATVLLSALYPAIVASRAANPGTADFKLPEPDGDSIAIEFPFTVAKRDIRGLTAFLKAWFDANTEASTGCFTAAEARAEHGGDASAPRHAVEAKVWLAPFDLGISQRFRLDAAPTDMKAIYGLKVRIDLLSGQRSNWCRANLAFMKVLRLQFLVWRTLSPETTDRYRALGGDADAARRLADGTHTKAEATATAGTAPALAPTAKAHA